MSKSIETIKLTISPNYIEWGVWESVRELLQNCKDSHDKGNAGTVRYDPELLQLTIANRGATLERSSLLMGGSIKRDDDTQIGCHGEGYKVAMTALMRLCKPVHIVNGNEVWTPSIRHDDTFGTEVVVIDISKGDTSRMDNSPTLDSLRVVVLNVTPMDWADILGKALFLGLPEPCTNGVAYHITDDIFPAAVYSSDIGDIISSRAGELYVRGLYVGKLPHNEWGVGFNLNNLKLNRDRDVPDYSDIGKEIAALFTAMGDDALAIYPLSEFIKGSPLTKMFYDSYDSAIALLYVAAFRAEYGSNAIAYCWHDADKIESVGLMPVQVSSDAYYLMQKVQSSVDSCISRAGEAYTLSDTSNFDSTNLDMAIGLVRNAIGGYEGAAVGTHISVVDFVDQGVEKRSVEECLYVSKGVASSLSKSLIALALHQFPDQKDRLELLSSVAAMTLGHSNV